MNYLLIILSLCLTASTLCAQRLERFVIGSAGLSNQTENIRLSFTVGEPVISRFNTSGIQLSQGFQQTQVTEVPTGIELPAYIQEIAAYPNPLGTTLYLNVITSKTFEFSVEVYSLIGEQQLIATDFLSMGGQVQHSVNVIGLAPGIYLLMIKTKEGYPVKIFKIQKM